MPSSTLSICLFMLGYLLDTIQSEFISQPTVIFMWSTDGRFGGKSAYKTHPHDVEELFSYFQHPEEDVQTTNLRVLYALKELDSNQIPEYASKGNLEALQEMMSDSGSSIVIPQVEISGQTTIADKFRTEGGELWTYAGLTSTGGAEWISDIVRDADIFSLERVYEMSEEGKRQTVVVPIDMDHANEAIRAVESALENIDHVSVLAPIEPVIRDLPSGFGGRRQLMSHSYGRNLANEATNSTTTDFADYIYFSADSTAGILFGLVMVWVIVLATSCTMDIQCPSQMWTHRDLPLKGRVDFG